MTVHYHTQPPAPQSSHVDLPPVRLGTTPLDFDQVVDIARHGRPVEIDPSMRPRR